MGREIQIKDGNADVVATWLAFLRKHQYYGVGMKANVYEYGGLETGAEMEKEAESVAKILGEVKLDMPINGGQTGERLQKLLVDEPFKGAWGAYTPSSGSTSVPHGNMRVGMKVVEETKDAAAPNTRRERRPRA